MVSSLPMSVRIVSGRGLVTSRFARLWRAGSVAVPRSGPAGSVTIRRNGPAGSVLGTLDRGGSTSPPPW